MDFCARLRKREWARAAVFVYIVESNYGGTPRSADFLKRLVQNKPCIPFCEDIEGKNRPGIWVTHDYKERFVQFMRGILKDGQLRFHDVMETRMKPDEAVRLVVNKLKNFRRVYGKNRSSQSGTVGEAHQTYKYSGKGKGRTDDATMAILECLFFLYEALRDRSYMNLFGLNPIASAKSKVKLRPNGQLYIESAKEAKAAAQMEAR